LPSATRSFSAPNRKEVLVVVRLALAAEITAAAEKGKP
jgi:hypothetical protein